MCIRFKHLYTHFEQHLLYTIRLCFSMQNWRTFAFSWYRNRRNRKKERYPNFKFRLQILNPFETQIKKRQEKGSVSRETELKKKILSCAAESVPFVEQKNQNISVGALLQKRTKPDAVPAQRWPMPEHPCTVPAEPSLHLSQNPLYPKRTGLSSKFQFFPKYQKK